MSATALVRSRAIRTDSVITIPARLRTASARLSDPMDAGSGRARAYSSAAFVVQGPFILYAKTTAASAFGRVFGARFAKVRSSSRTYFSPLGACAPLRDLVGFDVDRFTHPLLTENPEESPSRAKSLFSDFKVLPG